MSVAGLEGIVATQSAISSILDGVLTYRGMNIDELAEQATFEEVLYLLWNDHLPNKDQLAKLKLKLAYHGELPYGIISLLQSFPKGAHPMTMLRTALSALEMYEPDADDMSQEANRLKALKIQAKISSIVAGIQRVREGKEIIPPNPEYGFAQNFLYMVSGKSPDEISIKSLDTALVLHADHELNASTFASRVTVATLANIYSGIVSAVGTLSGPLHGGANEAVMNMLEDIGGMDQVESYIRQALTSKRKIMGFGHRVYRTGDPRAKILKKMSQNLTTLTGQSTWYNMSVRIEEILLKEKGLLPNVDFYSASMYHSLGISRELYTPIFAVSRTAGWTAHILEQYENNRLIRPRAEYVGSDLRPYVPMEQR